MATIHTFGWLGVGDFLGAPWHLCLYLAYLRHELPLLVERLAHLQGLLVSGGSSMGALSHIGLGMAS